ncbi:AEC family transporter [Mycoplasmopsis sturni]|uniref:AEC family transporter n=1 Tax=Mycoplasmopsis sturni TaxID=39047 RepID=UPI000565B8A3|nr:AEC family transporter [Mycoplasmopsis sturni]
MNDILKTLQLTLSETGFWGAVISTIVIIGIGYVLTKAKIIKPEWKGSLNSIVLKIALPALAISGFMKNITIGQLQEQGIILGVSFAFYVLLCVVAFLFTTYGSHLIPNRFKVNIDGTVAQSESRALVTWMMLIFGSITFFGLPIINAVSPKGILSANIWTIPYRIFLYSYCFMVMAGLKFDRNNITKSLKTAFMNPIVIATFVGIVLWMTQLIPGANLFGKNFTKGSNGWFNLSVTMPYLYTPISTLGRLASPLVWISIGITLAVSNIKKAVSSPAVWIFSALKLIAIPLVVFLIFLGLNRGGLVSIDSAIAMVIFAATPPATVVIAYAMQYKRHEEYAVQCSALTTLLAVVAIPLWIIICKLAFV